MEHQKILNLSNEANDSKFVIRKCNIVNYNSNSMIWNEIIIKTEVLKSNLCNYNIVYILVRGVITITGHQATQVAFKQCAPFTKCIRKTDETIIDDAEDFDLVMSMYNLIEYSSNFSKTTGSLWFYSKDEATDFNGDIANDDDFKSFKCKTNLLGNTVADRTNRILKRNNCCTIEIFK